MTRRVITAGQAGFTLVELALVMLIIGLLTGVGLKGQEMIANARVTATIAQVQAYQKAIGIFHDSYFAIPGDFNAAQACLRDCTTVAACFNGDGDSVVGTSAVAWQTIDSTLNSENTQVWRHLALADLIHGVATNGAQTGFEISHPASRMGGGFHARQADPVTGMADGVVLVWRNSPQGTWDSGSGAMVIAPKEAFKIDFKIDDGKAFSGYAYAVSDSQTNGCGYPNTGSNDASGYDENGTERSCDMIFKLWPAPLTP